MEKIENAVTEILKGIGEDPERQGLEKTPYRVAKMYKTVTTPPLRNSGHAVAARRPV